MLLSVVVPVFNEEQILPKFLDEIIDELERNLSGYELILVENGSTDKTKDLIKKVALKNKKIKPLFLQAPSYGKALRYGLGKAKGEYIIVFNVDFWKPEFIKLVKEGIFGADILIGSKNLPQAKDKRPVIRRLASHFLTKFLQFFFGYKGTDTHGIKIFRQEVISKILKNCQLENSLFDSEFLIRAQKAGFKIKEVPVEVKEVRPPRFKWRFLKTPKELCELYFALRKS